MPWLFSSCVVDLDKKRQQVASFSIVFWLKKIFLQLSVLSRQVGDLQADNLKLYEKIRFLQVIFFWYEGEILKSKHLQGFVKR